MSVGLSFNIDLDTGLEFQDEVVCEDGNLLNELFNQSLIKLCDTGFLPGDEFLQFLNPVHGFFSVMAVELGLFLLVAEPENFVSDGIVVLFVICLLDELFLQFFSNRQIILRSDIKLLQPFASWSNSL